MSDHQAISAEDRQLIIELLARYSWAFDAGDADGVATLFTENGVFHGSSGPIEGRSALREFVKRAKANAAECSMQHWVGNTVLTRTEGNAVRARSYLTVVLVGEHAEVRAAGEYDDLLVKESGEWRFTSRRYLKWPG
ncbi:nuclear transport factor 2 family protein [Pseudonocardia asaccharolytica]|uniref:SnoaL-like domain-containing protein n=1 Tax=Pseudonocardia asaccharolytica DSM 44247 = NBRC 16224 TaxID=1123024 RepID=A0A511D130_9PSEU|nr:nuclear transport factor 2 family protein [Pseudonocardia asaccharolytica]GEL17244.1 hypothetical protein PA7_10810 [Pseudonocardia asaccharolytica DSM 44247 = NBRC 16224]